MSRSETVALERISLIRGKLYQIQLEAIAEEALEFSDGPTRIRHRADEALLELADLEADLLPAAPAPAEEVR